MDRWVENVQERPLEGIQQHYLVEIRVYLGLST
jgi:hypothetical protein